MSAKSDDRRAYLLALRLITGAALRADPLRFAVTALGQAGMSVAGLLLSVYVKDLTNDLAEAHRERLDGHLIGLLVTTAVFFAAGSIGGTGLIRLSEVGGQRASRDLSELMLGLPTLDSFERPDVLDRVQILLQNRYILFVTVQMMGVLLRILAIVLPAAFLLGEVDPILILLPVAALPSLFLGPFASTRRNRWLDRNAATMRRRNATFDLATTPAAACEVRTFGMGPALHADYARLEHELVTGGRRVGDEAALLVSVGQLLPFVGYALALFVVLHRLRHGQASVGDITLVVTIAATIQQGMTYFGDFLSGATSMAAATRRLAWLFTYARSVSDEGATAIPPGALRSGLSLRDVGFSYAGGDAALEGVTIDIPAGTTVALVGQNGAGKSTLVKLLLGLYRPTRGQILVDGVDLATLDPALWRSSCAGSFQDHLRLKLPAGVTIGIGDLDAVDDTAAITAAAVRGGATDVLDGLPEGLETQLGKEFDGGTDLSGGQWQKLALARGMMRTEPLLLVLDEPTSALDPMTEAALFDSYAAHARATSARTGAITVLVSHRFSTVRNADLVLVVESGRLVEVGNHAELMARGGDYAQLYELQAASYR